MEREQSAAGGECLGWEGRVGGESPNNYSTRVFSSYMDYSSYR